MDSGYGSRHRGHGHRVFHAYPDRHAAVRHGVNFFRHAAVHVGWQGYDYFTQNNMAPIHHHGSIAATSKGTTYLTNPLKRARGNETHDRDNEVYRGVSYNKLSVVVNPPKHMKFEAGNHYLSQQHAYTALQSIRGTTYWTEMFTVGSRSQWLTTNTTYPFDGSGIKYFEVQPNLKITGGATYPAGTTTVGASQLYWKHCRVVLDLTSQVNSPMFCKIHVFKAVQNTADPPLVTWAGVANNQALGVTAEATATTAANIGAQGPYGGTTIANNPTVNNANTYVSEFNRQPTVFPDFKRMWKPIAVHEFNPAGGNSERVVFNFAMNYLGDSNRLTEANTYVKGSSLCFVLEMTGVVGKVTSSSTQPGAAHQLCEMSWVASVAHHFKPVTIAGEKIVTALGINYDTNQAGTVIAMGGGTGGADASQGLVAG